VRDSALGRPRKTWASASSSNWGRFARQRGCSVHNANITTRHIAEAVKRSQNLAAKGPLTDLPPYSPPPFPVPESQRVTLFDWAVLTCYPEEFKRQQHLLDLYNGDAANKAVNGTSSSQLKREEQQRMDLD
jgi:hypothetical protein